MNSKIIFFDIDGTILSHRNFTISDSTLGAIKQAKENGHLTFINTGRTFAEIDAEILNLGFDGFVCGCGTYISYNNSILLHALIDQKTRKELIQDFRTLKLNAILEGTSGIYFDEQPKDETVRFIEDMYKSHNFNVKTWDEPGIEFDKFCIWQGEPKAKKQFYEKYKLQFDFISRDGEAFWETIPKGYSKATGIKYLLDHLNIPYENAFALGDSSNDLAMLSYVKHSIGMGNSDQAVKDIVSYITRDVDEGGVAHALRHFNII